MSVGSTLLLSSFPFIWHSRWSLYTPLVSPFLSPPENWHSSEWSHFSFQGNLLLLLCLGQAKGAINNSFQHHLALTLSSERLLWWKTWEKTPVSLFERASGYVRSIPFLLTILGQLQWLIPPFPVDQVQTQSGYFILFMLFIHAFQCLSFVSWPVLPSVLFSG